MGTFLLSAHTHSPPVSTSDSIKLGTVRTIGRPINRCWSGLARGPTWRSGTPREQIKEGERGRVVLIAHPQTLLSLVPLFFCLGSLVLLYDFSDPLSPYISDVV